MRLVTYNIQYSRGLDGRYDLARCAEAVRGADVIALQEVERNWPRGSGDNVPVADQPAALARSLPDYYWVYGPAFDMHGGPGPGPYNCRRQHGVMLLSRQPIVSARLDVLPKTHYDDRYNMVQSALRALIESPLGVLDVCNIHLGYLDARERLMQLDFLDALQQRLPGEHGAWSGPGHIRGDDWSAAQPPPPAPVASIWLGDFNSTPDSTEHALITQRGLTDTWAAAGNSAHEGASHVRITVDAPSLLRRLDYVFVAAALVPRVRAAWIDEQALGSDHRPVWAELA